MKILTLLTTVVLLLALCPSICVRAETSADIDSHIKAYDIQKFDSEIESKVGEIEGFEGESFTDIVYRILNGEINIGFTDMLKFTFQRLFKEVYDSIGIMRNLIIIAILSAVLKSLGKPFQDGEIGQAGFYIVYISLVTLLIVSFLDTAELAKGVIEKAVGVMQTLLPLIMALLIASGRYSISFVFHPATVAVIEIASFIVETVVLNLIIFAAAVQLVNYLLPEGTLDGMATLVKKTIEKGLKWLSVAFMAVMTLQTAAAPIMGGLVSKGARVAVSAVPGVGSVFKGAVDSVYLWGNTVKNGVAVAVIVFLILLCFVPIIKIAAIAFIYKFTAAIIQPLADERITGAINACGSYIVLFIEATLTVSIMFITLMMMVIAGAIG